MPVCTFVSCGWVPVGVHTVVGVYMLILTSGHPECPNITLFIYIILYYIFYITMVYCNLHCIYLCTHLAPSHGDKIIIAQVCLCGCGCTCACACACVHACICMLHR